jgi:hypothetical protein
MVALPNAPRFPVTPPELRSMPQASATGFTIVAQAQLGDLIQINCLNRIQGAFRVTSGDAEGELYFQGGLLVHAACGACVGLDAVVQMLGWRGGSIEPCTVPWPAETTIGMGADALLLCAAQRLDERTRDDERARSEAARGDMTTKVVRRVSLPDADPVALALPQRAERQSGVSLKSPLSVESLSRLEVTRVSPEGNIQASRAPASTDLADTAFYCQRLASLVGEGLGLGACRALACENAREGVVVFEARSIVGVRGQRKDLELVLAKVGLE